MEKRTSHPRRLDPSVIRRCLIARLRASHARPKAAGRRELPSSHSHYRRWKPPLPRRARWCLQRLIVGGQLWVRGLMMNSARFLPNTITENPKKNPKTRKSKKIARFFFSIYVEDYIWLHMATYGYIWLHMATFGYICLHLSTYSYI